MAQILSMISINRRTPLPGICVEVIESAKKGKGAPLGLDQDDLCRFAESPNIIAHGSCEECCMIMLEKVICIVSHSSSTTQYLLWAFSKGVD